MRKLNIAVFAFVACILVLFISVAVIFVENGIIGGVAASDPIEVPPAGYQGFPGWTPPGDFPSAGSAVYRAVPSYISVPDDVWNYGTLEEILNAAMAQLEAARSRGSITQAQYDMLLAEVFNIRQSIGYCITDTDAKTMLRSRYGGSGKAFSDIYPKMIDCMKKKMAEKTEPVEEKAPVEAPALVPKTAYDGEWSLFVYEGDIAKEGRLDLYNFKGAFYLPMNSAPINGTMEIVEDGFNFWADQFKFAVGVITDPDNSQFEVRKGTIYYLMGDQYPVTLRRAR